MTHESDIERLSRESGRISPQARDLRDRLEAIVRRPESTGKRLLGVLAGVLLGAAASAALGAWAAIVVATFRRILLLLG